MGLRGPAPIPTAINAVRGNPGKRTPNRREPKPKLGRPAMPEHLSDAAKVEWEKACATFERMGVLTEADGVVLGILCFDRAELAKAQLELQKINITLTEKGVTFMNPLHKPLSRAVDMLSTRVSRGEAQFGGSPSARTRVSTAQPEKPESAWAKFS